MMRYTFRFIGFHLIFLVALSLFGCSGSDDPVDLRLKRVGKLIALGKLDAARTEIENAIKADPSRTETYSIAMSVYESRKLYSDAAAMGERLLDLAKRSKLDRSLNKEQTAWLLLRIGRDYWEAKNYSSAERIYRTALEISPNNAYMLNEIGYFFADACINLHEALRYTKKAVEQYPENGAYVDSLGWALYRLSHYEAAVETLEKAVKLEPDAAEIRYHLGAAYVKVGKKTAAWVELKKALVLDPNQEEAAKLLGTIHK